MGDLSDRTSSYASLISGVSAVDLLEAEERPMGELEDDCGEEGLRIVGLVCVGEVDILKVRIRN